MPTDRATRQARHNQASVPRTKRGVPSPNSGSVGDQAFTQNESGALVHLVKGSTGWKKMGVSTEDSREAITVVGGAVSGGGGAAGVGGGAGIERIVDSAATPSEQGGQHANLPSGHVNLIKDSGEVASAAVLYNVKSANSNLAIEADDDGSGSDFIKFTSVDTNTTYTLDTSPHNNGAQLDLVPSVGSDDSVVFLEGTNISIDRTSGTEITINSTVNTSSFLSNAVGRVEGENGSITFANTAGSDTVRFASGGGITWAVSGPTSDVITVTPSFSGSYDNYGSWTFKEGNGEETGTVGSGQTLQFEQGTGIEVELTGTRVLTITNTSPDVNHNTDTHWEGDTIGSASIARNTLGLGAAAVAAIGASSGQVAAGDHTHSGYIATSHEANNVTSGHILMLGYLDANNTQGCTGDQTLPTRASLNIATDDDVLFDDVRIANNLYLNNYSNSTNNMIRFHHNNSSAYQDWKGGYWYIRHEATTKFRLTSGGQLDCDGDVVAYSTAVSDIRLKDNIEPMKGNLEKLSMLTPISYEYKEKRDGKHLGLSAQEVEEVFPDIVNEMDLMSFGKEGEEYKTVRQQELIPVLIGAIKELKEELEFVKRKVRG